MHSELDAALAGTYQVERAYDHLLLVEVDLAMKPLECMDVRARLAQCTHRAIQLLPLSSGVRLPDETMNRDVSIARVAKFPQKLLPRIDVHTSALDA